MQPTLVFLPGESHGQRNLAGYSPQGDEELDMTEHTRMHTYIHPKQVECVHILVFKGIDPLKVLK